MLNLIIQETKTSNDKACLIYHNFFMRKCIVETIRTLCKITSLSFIALLLYVLVFKNLFTEIASHGGTNDGVVGLCIFLLCLVEIGLAIAVVMVVSSSIKKILDLHEQIVAVEGETLKQWL